MGKSPLITHITNKNRLSIKFSELIKEWHPTKNGNKTPADFSFASHKKIWWLCRKCSYTYHSAISKRTLKNKPRGCPACSGRVVSDLNRLSIKFPELSKEWHPIKMEIKLQQIFHLEVIKKFGGYVKLNITGTQL